MTSHAKTLVNYVSTAEAISPTVLSLLREKQQASSPPLQLRLMGVRLSNLRRKVGAPAGARGTARVLAGGWAV